MYAQILILTVRILKEDGVIMGVQQRFEVSKRIT